MAQIMEFILNLLLLRGKFLTTTAAEKFQKAIRSCLYFKRRISMEYNTVSQMMDPFENMLQFINYNSKQYSCEGNNYVVTSEVRYELRENFSKLKRKEEAVEQPEKIDIKTETRNFEEVSSHNNQDWLRHARNPNLKERTHGQEEDYVVDNLHAILKSQDFLLKNVIKLVNLLEKGEVLSSENHKLQKLKNKMSACSDILSNQKKTHKFANIINNIIEEEITRCRFRNGESKTSAEISLKAPKHIGLEAALDGSRRSRNVQNTQSTPTKKKSAPKTLIDNNKTKVLTQKVSKTNSSLSLKRVKSDPQIRMESTDKKINTADIEKVKKLLEVNENQFAQCEEALWHIQTVMKFMALKEDYLNMCKSAFYNKRQFIAMEAAICKKQDREQEIRQYQQFLAVSDSMLKITETKLLQANKSDSRSRHQIQIERESLKNVNALQNFKVTVSNEEPKSIESNFSDNTRNKQLQSNANSHQSRSGDFVVLAKSDNNVATTTSVREREEDEAARKVKSESDVKQTSKNEQKSPVVTNKLEGKVSSKDLEPKKDIPFVQQDNIKKLTNNLRSKIENAKYEKTTTQNQSIPQDLSLKPIKFKNQLEEPSKNNAEIESKKNKAVSQENIQKNSSSNIPETDFTKIMEKIKTKLEEQKKENVDSDMNKTMKNENLQKMGNRDKKRDAYQEIIEKMKNKLEQKKEIVEAGSKTIKTADKEILHKVPEKKIEEASHRSKSKLQEHKTNDAEIRPKASQVNLHKSSEIKLEPKIEKKTKTEQFGPNKKSVDNLRSPTTKSNEKSQTKHFGDNQDIKISSDVTPVLKESKTNVEIKYPRNKDSASVSNVPRGNTLINLSEKKQTMEVSVIKNKELVLKSKPHEPERKTPVMEESNDLSTKKTNFSTTKQDKSDLGNKFGKSTDSSKSKNTVDDKTKTVPKYPEWFVSQTVRKQIKSNLKEESAPINQTRGADTKLKQEETNLKNKNESSDNRSLRPQATKMNPIKNISSEREKPEEILKPPHYIPYGKGHSSTQLKKVIDEGVSNKRKNEQLQKDGSTVTLTERKRPLEDNTEEKSRRLVANVTRSEKLLVTQLPNAKYEKNQRISVDEKDAELVRVNRKAFEDLENTLRTAKILTVKSEKLSNTVKSTTEIKKRKIDDPVKKNMSTNQFNNLMKRRSENIKSWTKSNSTKPVQKTKEDHPATPNEKCKTFLKTSSKTLCEKVKDASSHKMELPSIEVQDKKPKFDPQMRRTTKNAMKRCDLILPKTAENGRNKIVQTEKLNVARAKLKRKAMASESSVTVTKSKDKFIKFNIPHNECVLQKVHSEKIPRVCWEEEDKTKTALILKD